jgi:hypothetical protein
MPVVMRHFVKKQKKELNEMAKDPESILHELSTKSLTKEILNKIKESK